MTVVGGRGGGGLAGAGLLKMMTVCTVPTALLKNGN